MRSSEEVFSKFPELEAQVREKLFRFAEILRGENSKINLVSRKDEEDIAYRHVAFCLSITKFLKPNRGAKIVDVGSGGGLPGLVMAAAWPDCEIFMLDGVGKKMEAVKRMAKILGLENAVAKKGRIEEIKETFDYATGRSVCALPKFFGFVKKALRPGKSGNLENGVIYFKGGDLEEELAKKNILPDFEMSLKEFFADENYEGKRLVHFSRAKILKFAGI